MGFKLFAGSFLLFFLASCNHLGVPKRGESSTKVLSPKKYVSWLRDPNNGICKKKEINDITFICQFKPLDYIVCMEEKKDVINDSLLIKREEDLKEMEYYEFTIKLTSGQGELLKYHSSSTAQYEERVKYYAFEMQKDITLVRENDSLPCSLFHFERAYDVAPYAKFMLGFTRDANSENKKTTIIYNDRIFDKGLIKFTYSEDDFKSIPKLQTHE